MRSIRVLVADDHEVVRRGVASVLEAVGCEIVGEVANGRDAVLRAGELRPDIVVLDLAMPGLNGMDATAQIVKRTPRTQVLALTVHEADPFVRGALTAGARGYVAKADVAQDLVLAVQALAAGKTFFSSRVADALHEAWLQVGSTPSGGVLERLTTREREVLQLLAEGKSNKETGFVLGISPKTVETHRTRIMRAFNCHSIGELVRIAIRNGLIEP